MGQRSASLKGFFIFYKDVFEYIWEEVVKSIIITAYIRNPCKSKKCLVRMSCTKPCEKRSYYAKYCDSSGGIAMQKLLSYVILLGVFSGMCIITNSFFN